MARDTIINELYNSGIITIGDNCKSIKMFGLDGEQHNMRFSWINNYASKKFFITSIEFDEDIQKILCKIEK